MPSFWSQPTWIVIHVYAYTYEFQKKHDSTGKQHQDYHKQFVTLLHSFAVSMPCQACRQHLKKYLLNHPIPYEIDLFQYSVDLHNAVNILQKKKVVSYNYALQLIQDYISHFPSRQESSSIIEMIANKQHNKKNISLYTLSVIAAVLFILCGCLSIKMCCKK